MDSISNALKDLCLTFGFQRTYWVGYSGGMDSQVLLHALAQLRREYPLKLYAVYINHNLSSHAENWATHCRDFCRREDILFSDFVIDATPSLTESPEAIARRRRYAHFATLLAPTDLLLTAHHQDDQAETVLLQMLRGAGPKGLAAMPRLKAFAQGSLVRPLLNFTRDALHTYATEQQLTWIEDESNTNTQFMRNFLRHAILPLVKQRLPTVAQTLARVAENCAETQHVLDEIAAQDLLSVNGSMPGTLSLKKLALFTRVRQRFILRAWLSQRHFPLPSALKLRHIQQDMLQAQQDKAPCVQWSDVELRRYRDDLYAMRCLALQPKAVSVEWDFAQPLTLTEGNLTATLTQGQGLHAAIQTVSVRFRQGGETIQLPNRSCHHDVKKLFQAWGVPPWLRDRIPFIYIDEQLAAIAGFAVSAQFSAKKNTAGFVLRMT